MRPKTVPESATTKGQFTVATSRIAQSVSLSVDIGGLTEPRGSNVMSEVLFASDTSVPKVDAVANRCDSPVWVGRTVAVIVAFAPTPRLPT